MITMILPTWFVWLLAACFFLGAIRTVVEIRIHCLKAEALQRQYTDEDSQATP